ncbi:maltase A3-like [Neocloeon triangulifer]|uniref:maltase A3-like n=1 Tax=Neocloeon triangulifer TaxID=2078957 RepID=UPI00286EFF65|nr:maltase A3-like [Neocloeon triangulifer]
MRVAGAFAIALVAQLAAAQIIDEDWWKNTTIYQIYPRSFKDTNADGIGDLRGILQQIYHPDVLGIGAVWLSPIFKSPMKDFGYDISDFRDIDPIFGTMADFDALVEDCRKRGLKLVLDFVPNHSSDEHEWFIKSVAREEPYTNYYTWLDPKGFNESGSPIPPNNWLSVFGGSAWEFNEQRQQFYLHQFTVGQPDLNYRNPAVIEEMNDILRFWMDKGADGFRLDATPHLMEDQSFPDEPLSNDPEFTSDQWGYLSHIYTTDLPELYDVIYGFRDVVDQKQAELGRQMVMMVEAYTSLENTMKYYGSGDRKGAHFPFNFELITKFNNETTAAELKQIIDNWQNNLPDGAWSNWVIGNHDTSRVASRLGREFGLAAVIMGQLLPGTAITYNGEEINMEDTWISWRDTVDPPACQAGPENYQRFSRDPERTPFHWDNSTYAGFTTSDSNKPWLPVNENYKEINVRHQLYEGPKQPYWIYEKLIDLRTEIAAVQRGNLTTSTVGDNIFAFTRVLADDVLGWGLFVVVNFDYAEVTADVTSSVTLLQEGTKLFYETGTLESNYIYYQQIDPSSVTIPARGALVFRYIVTSSATSVAASCLSLLSAFLALINL